jgi:hypothetical protein
MKAKMKNESARSEMTTSDGMLQPFWLAVSLFCISYGTALFALSVFKILSFFIMPSLFFDLLFIGFPLGAWIGVRFGGADRRFFLHCLWGLQGVMAASVASCLLAKRFDYLRAHLFDIELSRLVAQIVTFVAMFLPFFAAYGLCEYLAYQVGRRHLGGRMRSVYALALFGAAMAYLSLRTLLPTLGMARMLVLAFIILAMAILIIGERWPRRVAVFEIGALLVGSCLPRLEGEFLALYKGQGAQSTWDFGVRQGCQSVFQKWGRYCLCEILASPDQRVYFGFYNDMFQWEYARRSGFTQPSLGALPILISKPGQHLAIVGAGGGRQVRLAERLGGRSIVAIELEPAVFEAVRSPEYLLKAFGRVYEAPGVMPVRAEARRYFEGSRQKFDLIYLPSVGSYPQMMIEPGNMVRTLQAYRTMRDRLTEQGILAIWYPLGLDTKGILTDQYVRTLRALGLKTQAYRNDFEFLILAFRDPETVIPGLPDLGQLLTLGNKSFSASAEFEALRPRIYPVSEDPEFAPITDQKPFLAGNVRYILSLAQISILFALAGSTLGLVGGAVWWGLRRRGDPKIRARPFSAVAGLALLIGANFLIMEHALVLTLFRRLYVYEDALGLGAIGFLTLSGLGSLLLHGRVRPAVMVTAAVAMVVFSGVAARLSVAGVLLAIVPIALATGMFFPALFDLAAQNPLAVFAFDAVGAGWGALAATFIPIVWGIDAFTTFSGTVFLLTVIIDAWFHRHSNNRSRIVALVQSWYTSATRASALAREPR